MTRTASILFLAFLLSSSPALSDGLKPATWRLLFQSSYAPPAPVRQVSVWWRKLPLSQGEAMSQSLCCAMVPPVCGLPSCRFAARTYLWTTPHHLSRDYLTPFSPVGDPHRHVRFLILDAMLPIVSIRYDFLPTYQIMVIGPEGAKP